MSRVFVIFDATKPAQKNQSTTFKFDKTRKFTGTPDRAAKKAMTYLCGHESKKIKGRCTLTITVQEVKPKMIDGIDVLEPVFDSRGIPKLYKYKLKRSVKKDAIPIEFNDTEIIFKYDVKVLESFGRVLPKNIKIT